MMNLSSYKKTQFQAAILSHVDRIPSVALHGYHQFRGGLLPRHPLLGHGSDLDAERFPHSPPLSDMAGTDFAGSRSADADFLRQ